MKTQHHYDNLVRLDETSWTVNGEVFKVSTTYDALDRPDTVAYPEVVGLGRTTIQQKYNALGEVERIDDISPGQKAKTLWEVKDRNRDGALTTSVTGDGLTTTNAYNADSGLLEDIRVQLANGADVYHVGMLYDDAGRMETRTDYVKQREEQFANDDLSRLKSWHLTTPTALHRTAYTYDRVSNLEKVTRDGIMQQQYAHGNNGRPHAILNDGKPLGIYNYDHRGRVVNGGGRSIAYTDFDLPTSVTTNSGTTFFQYDAASPVSRLSSPVFRLPSFVSRLSSPVSRARLPCASPVRVSRARLPCASPVRVHVRALDPDRARARARARRTEDGGRRTEDGGRGTHWARRRS